MCTIIYELLVMEYCGYFEYIILSIITKHIDEEIYIYFVDYQQVILVH